MTQAAKNAPEERACARERYLIECAADMTFSFKTLLYISSGCFLGGALRYMTAALICSRWSTMPPNMPWHTLLINFVGCLFMGIFSALAGNGLIEDTNMRAALMTGLCGGYSTLAAFALENTFILKSGSYLTSGVYIFATVAGSILFFILGYAITQHLTHS